MKPIRTVAALAAPLALVACSGLSSGRTGMIAPGKDRTAAAFQQDQAICQQHALAHTGWDVPAASAARAPAPPAPSASAPANQSGPADPTPAQRSDDLSFMQCMAARGDTVRMASADDLYPSTAPYPYAYPSPYRYPYASALPGFTFVFGGLGFHHRFHHHDFHHGGFRHGGFHHGGFHHGGFHR
jgi:hypothetical protein